MIRIRTIVVFAAARQLIALGEICTPVYISQHTFKDLLSGTIPVFSLLITNFNVMVYPLQLFACPSVSVANFLSYALLNLLIIAFPCIFQPLRLIFCWIFGHR